MKKHLFLSLLYGSFLLLSLGCKQESSTMTGQELSPISYEEMTDLVLDNKLVMSDNVIYLDREGTILDTAQKNSFSDQLPDALWFVDQNNILVKVQLQDPEQAREALRNTPVFKDIDLVNCNNLNRILEKIYDRDQEHRASDGMDPDMDEINLGYVIQIIDKCGMPTLETAGKKGMTAVWLVIQHSDEQTRKTYFPMLLEAARKGDLERQDIALMQDRMLMETGKPQLYGSQVIMENGVNYELYDLKEPETVDQRRAIMGMGPLIDYLNHFNIEFNVPQKSSDK
jgi:hypothetical protein